MSCDINVSDITANIHETIRNENIKRNMEMLQTIGIYDIKNELKGHIHQKMQTTKPKKKGKDHIVMPPQRFSKRIKTCHEIASNSNSSVLDENSKPVTIEKSASYPRTYLKSIYRNPILDLDLKETWINNKVNSASDTSLPLTKCTWNDKTKHQHLECSQSKKIVVTTGCAGYGGIYCTNKEHDEAVISSKGTECTSQTWNIIVLKIGVGGFAIGVTSIKPLPSVPFKSLSNRNDCWMFHANGAIIHNRKIIKQLSEKDMYDADDIIRVTITNNVCTFYINNIPIGYELKLPVGSYVLCCQPYMGGGCYII